MTTSPGQESFRLTMGQTPVKYLQAQYSEREPLEPRRLEQLLQKEAMVDPAGAN